MNEVVNNPVTVELSVKIGVGFCVLLNDSSVFLIGIYIWELWNTLMTPASSSDAMTYHSVLH